MPSFCVFFCHCCCFLKWISHQSLHSAARRAVQCDDLAAWRAHHLGAHETLGGNAHLKHLMDGLPETVKVVVYQAWGGKRETTDENSYLKKAGKCERVEKVCL